MIIGSVAGRYWFPDFPRQPKDLDIFTPDEKIEGGEAELFWHNSFPEYWGLPGYADPSFLYSLKVSHAFWDIGGSWEKHMHDILFYQSKDVLFDRQVYDTLFPVWKEKHGRKRVNLNMTKDSFFADAVNRKYDHDSLHDSVAYGDVPMYTKILKDGSDVLVDNDKFWAMSQEDKFKTIREETYATALERWVVPSNYTCSPRAAYARAMKKCITSLFKGEWALFIVLNYTELCKPDMDYVKRHRENSDKLILL